MPIIYRDSTVWPGAVAQDSAFLLPASLPAKGSAAALVQVIYGPPYQQVLPAYTVQAVLRRRQSIEGAG